MWTDLGENVNLLNTEVAVNGMFSPQKLLTIDHHPRASDTPLSSLSGLPVGAQHVQSLFSLPAEVSESGAREAYTVESLEECHWNGRTPTVERCW